MSDWTVLAADCLPHSVRLLPHPRSRCLLLPACHLDIALPHCTHLSRLRGGAGRHFKRRRLDDRRRTMARADRLRFANREQRNLEQSLLLLTE